jgi:uncharacterized protein (TIGR02284 family)
MNMSQHDISVLNSLTTTTLDSLKGFREAADDVNSAQYAQIFADFASERSSVASQLQQEVTRLGKMKAACWQPRIGVSSI